MRVMELSCVTNAIVVILENGRIAVTNYCGGKMVLFMKMQNAHLLRNVQIFTFPLRVIYICVLPIPTISTV